MNPPLFLALVLLASCSPSPVAEENGSASSRSPPTSLADQYPIFKAAALEATKAEIADSGEPPYLLQEQGDEKIFDVIDCMEFDRNPEVRVTAGKAGSVEALARRIAFLDLNFAGAGYSREVYEGPLRAYEDWSLAAILQGEEPKAEGDRPGLEGPAQRQAQQRFAEQVEANRAKLQPSQPEVVVEGGCGAGETPYMIKVQPADGRAWLVSRFGFSTCKAMGLDPWDREKCDRWDDVDPNRTVWLAGTYVYQARWRNGAVGRGTKRLESAADSPEQTQIVTIGPD